MSQLQSFVPSRLQFFVSRRTATASLFLATLVFSACSEEDGAKQPSDTDQPGGDGDSIDNGNTGGSPSGGDGDNAGGAGGVGGAGGAGGNPVGGEVVLACWNHCQAQADRCDGAIDDLVPLCQAFCAAYVDDGDCPKLFEKYSTCLQEAEIECNFGNPVNEDACQEEGAPFEIDFSGGESGQCVGELE